MIRGTTPRLEFTLPFDVSQIEKSYITFMQDNTIVLDKTFDDCEAVENMLIVNLTQEETLKLKAGKVVEMQIRVRTISGDALASNIIRVNAERILRDGVI